MSTLRVWLARLASLFRRRALDERLDEELGFHVEMESRALMAEGMDAEQARREARLRLAPGGALERIRESHRAGRGVPPLERLVQDLRLALRTLRQSPGFAAVALLSLAFGIGTNCAIWSVVDALLLKPLPVAGADRLTVLSAEIDGQPDTLFSYPAFRLLADPTPVATGVMAVTEDFTAVVRWGGGMPGGATVPAGSGETELADSQLVSGNFFALLGVGAAAGRTFTPADDDRPGRHPVAVMSYGYWQRRFGGDPAVLGRALLVNGSPFTVLGVLPRGFRGVLADEAPDLFLPVTEHDAVSYLGSMTIAGPEDPGQPVWSQVNRRWLKLLAMRRPGVSLEQAGALLGVLFERERQAELVGRTDPADRRRLLAERLLTSSGARGLADRRETLTQPLLVLMGLAVLVLLIACTNVAALLMARADRRRKEMAVRLGIGAGRSRLLRQLLTESLLLAGLGGILGLLFASWGSRLLLRLISQDADPVPLDVDLDWRKLAFALGVALITGVAFGLLTEDQDAGRIAVPGHVPQPQENLGVQHNSVTPRYFATVGLPLLAGRPLAARDRAGAPAVAVVNEELVRRFLPAGSPIGRRFGFGGPEHAHDIEVVGVVKDGKYHRFDEAAAPLAYLPVAQIPARMHEANVLRDLELRLDPAAGDAAVAAVAAQLRQAVASVAPDLPVLSISTMREQRSLSLARQRAIADLTGFFGALALLLAAIGLYGVMAYGVARRTGEIGLRMALGASRREILGLAMRETVVLLACGAAAGLLATWALGRLAASQLYGITAHDPATLLGALAALSLVALVAGLLPARRAAGVEPGEALRHE